MFIAVGHNGLRASSPDGEHWSAALLGKEGETYRGVCFGKDRYVAFGSYGGSNIFAASLNGIEWQTSQQDAKYARYVRGIGFGDERFVALGGDPGAVGSANAFTLTSTDGIAWSDFHDMKSVDAQGKETGGKFVLRRLAFGETAFGEKLCVGVGDRGRRSYSIDGGITWSDVPDTKPTDTLIDVAYGRGIFIGVGLHGLRMSTRDGKAWSPPQRGEEGEHCNSVVFTGEAFVAVGQGGTYISPDGGSWQRHANQLAPTCCSYGNKTFVGSSWKGRVLRSSDGIAWREVHKFEQHVEAVGFGG